MTAGSSPTSSAKRLARSKSSAGNKALDVFTGLRLDDVDVDTQAKSLEYEYRDYLRNKAEAAGLRRRGEYFYPPKEKK